MEVINILKLKKRLVMREYQEVIVSDIISKFGMNKPYVLGSCPSSGKTEMAIEAMVRLMESGEVDRVLILAHSTNVLKKNFYDRLMEYFHEGKMVSIKDGRKNYNYDARIQVMIPQNINHINGEFDLIIVDEAQHNVLADDGNYTRIIESVRPKFQLLLTGTPSKFVLENNLAEDQNNLPYHINCVGMDMIGFEHFHDVRFDLIKSAYNFTNEDYNRTHELSEETKFSFEETQGTVMNVIIGAVINIAKRNGYELSKNADIITEGIKLIKEGKFGKTLIMCRNIEQADQVSKIISDLFKIKVEVSHSKNDSESIELKNFKEGRFDFLCVVNRAREGYDDKKVVNLIDITMTHNIDLIYQMFCRVIRKDDTNPNTKLYLKVTSNADGMPAYTMNIMTAALMLGSTKNLSQFNGRNFRGVVIPRIEMGEEVDDDPIVDAFVETIDENGDTIGRRRISSIMAMDLVQMFKTDEENLIHGNDRYAMTTLGESLDILSGDNYYHDKEGYFELMRKENIISGNQWATKCQELSKRDGINYIINVWTYFKQPPNEFFNECYPEKNLAVDKITLFDIIKKEKIKNSGQWINNYKKIREKYNNPFFPVFPWENFNQTTKQFFDECYPDNVLCEDKNTYIDLIKKENLNINTYQKKYKELSERDKIKYHSEPWKLFNQIAKQFFDECHLTLKDKEQYFDIIKKEKITNNGMWSDNYKIIGLKYNVKLLSTPWILSNQTAKDFFDECYNRIKFCEDKNIYFYVIRKEKITNNQIWGENYKNLSKRDNMKYHSNPWNLYNQKPKDFFDECYPERVLCDIKEDYFIAMKNEDISSSQKWMERYVDLRNRYDKKFKAKPWVTFKQTISEFFNEYREWLKTNQDTTLQHKPVFLGEFSEMNKQWNTANSRTTHENIAKNPEEWFKYHKLYKKSRKNWAEIPYIEIAKKLKERPDWVVGDFGCGEDLLSKEITNKVYAFDHYAIDENVISCDLCEIPLENNKLDVVVFSLSLMGSNYKDYFKEANRVLKPMGLLMIAEPATRWEDKEDSLKEMLTEAGFKVNGEIKFSDRFIYVTSVKM